MEKDEKLINAAHAGNLEVVKCLVEQGADIHIDNELPLRYASYKGHLEIVKYLVDHGADIHIYLRHVVYSGHLEVVKYLVEQGTDIHIDEDSTLRDALERGHLEIVQYLRKIAGDRWKCHKCLVSSMCTKLCDDWNNL
jgi:ankyrin repeat protein